MKKSKKQKFTDWLWEDFKEISGRDLGEMCAEDKLSMWIAFCAGYEARENATRGERKKKK
jgi:hypothetical protein